MRTKALPTKSSPRKLTRFGYEWCETGLNTVEMWMACPPGTKGKDIVWQLKPNMISFGFKGSDLIINQQKLGGILDLDECAWQIDETPDGPVLHAELTKAPPVTGASWPFFAEHESIPDPTVTHIAKFAVSVDGRDVGTLTMELRGRQAPLAVANFVALCNGTDVLGNPSTHSYAGTLMHRLIVGFMAQGGTHAPPESAAGAPVSVATHVEGAAICNDASAGAGGFRLRIEDASQPFDSRGVVAAVATQDGSGLGCGYFITFAACPHLGGSHVALGHVSGDAESARVLAAIEAAGSPTGRATGVVLVTASVATPVDL